MKQFMNVIQNKSRFKKAQLCFNVAKVRVTKFPIKMSAQWSSMELNFEVLSKRNRKKLLANKWKCKLLVLLLLLLLLLLLQINQNKNFVLIKLINYLKINLSAQNFSWKINKSGKTYFEYFISFKLSTRRALNRFQDCSWEPLFLPVEHRSWNRDSYTPPPTHPLKIIWKFFFKLVLLRKQSLDFPVVFFDFGIP